MTRRPFFTLVVATSADGYISRNVHEPPQAWASPEEQERFFADVDAADWAVMGRNTHLAADKPERRRIIFSAKVEGWQRPTQLWIDPVRFQPEDMPVLVAQVHGFRHGVILGGTRVHDWFLQTKSIDRVHLTIEPVRFGSGLPIFSGSEGVDPAESVARTGLHLASETVINDLGTRYLIWTKES